MKRILLSALLAISLASCNVVDTVSDGFRHSQEVSADLEKAMGTKPLVGFNWSNGSLTSVTVAFDGIPSGISNEEIASLARKSISIRFKQAPRQIVISYSVSGSGS